MLLAGTFLIKRIKEGNVYINSGYDEKIGIGFIELSVKKTTGLTIDDFEYELSKTEVLTELLDKLSDYIVTPNNCYDFTVNVEVTESRKGKVTSYIKLYITYQNKITAIAHDDLLKKQGKN